ncbi:hypothetical protein NQ317_001151 [Molorchus minor]|uniref:Ionotropic glutamate receptor C-terminal domain-containing protein n=1 Tax=Molorchus minor TaxID=1323400 RepID=A0ABQ9JEQ4_9CUCU|nr:hypothetical protein NQ317_001151 [Molorchus minor]
MVTSAWWFFSLIMTACYTANLAAFLTMERMGPTIESAADLASQTKIKYGCVKDGSTAAFFRDSNFSVYHSMWVQMESATPKSVFEKNNEDGVARVLNSKRQYAFLMESSSIEYEKEKHCELMQVGNPLDSKGYGIAMPTNIYKNILLEGFDACLVEYVRWLKLDNGVPKIFLGDMDLSGHAEETDKVVWYIFVYCMLSAAIPVEYGWAIFCMGHYGIIL